MMIRKDARNSDQKSFHGVRYQMSLEDASMKHGDETQPIENPEAHLQAYRQSVKIMQCLGSQGSHRVVETETHLYCTSADL